jgi:hypothetical protein
MEAYLMAESLNEGSRSVFAVELARILASQGRTLEALRDPTFNIKTEQVDALIDSQTSVHRLPVLRRRDLLRICHEFGLPHDAYRHLMAACVATNVQRTAIEILPPAPAWELAVQAQQAWLTANPAQISGEYWMPRGFSTREDGLADMYGPMEEAFQRWDTATALKAIYDDRVEWDEAYHYLTIAWRQVKDAENWMLQEDPEVQKSPVWLDMMHEIHTDREDIERELGKNSKNK